MESLATQPVELASQSVELDAQTIASLRKQCQRSLFFLARGVLGFKDLTAHIHKPICDMLQRRDKKRRLIVLPRTWFKSSIVIAYCVWSEINNPNIRQLIAQNTFDNAKKKVGSVRMIWEKNALLRALFPELLPTTNCRWSDECMMLNRTVAVPEGTLEPAGTGTAVTSRHYDEVIEDDTVAPDFDAMTGEIQQPTVAEIEKAIGFHKMCHPLLLHPTESFITVVGTRWAVEDLIGWVLKHNPEYDVVSRAILEDPDGLPAAADQGGEPIWDRFGWEAIDEIKRTIGLLMFEMLYMGNPSSGVNRVFRREMIRYYDNLPTELVYFTSVDPASAKPTRKTDPDYTVVLTAAVKPSTGEVFVVHYNRGRVDPGETIAWIFNHWRCYKSLVVRVESTQYQSTLKYWIEQRQKQENEFFYVEPVTNADSTKVARCLGLEPWFAAGKVRIRVEHTDLERELLNFDNTREELGHDDVRDALSMLVPLWSKVTETWRKNKEAEEVLNPLSGRAIIEELIGRSRLARSYPYDIGLMSERLAGLLPREDYVEAEEVFV